MIPAWILVSLLLAYLGVALAFSTTAWDKVPGRPGNAIEAGSEGEIAAAKVRAYHRTAMAPIWPVLLMHDAIKGYRQAREAQQPYLLEQSARKLEKAKQYSDNLVKAQREAEEAIENARYEATRISEADDEIARGISVTEATHG